MRKAIKPLFHKGDLVENDFGERVLVESCDAEGFKSRQGMLAAEVLTRYPVEGWKIVKPAKRTVAPEENSKPEVAAKPAKAKKGKKVNKPKLKQGMLPGCSAEEQFLQCQGDTPDETLEEKVVVRARVMIPAFYDGNVEMTRREYEQLKRAGGDKTFEGLLGHIDFGDLDSHGFGIEVENFAVVEEKAKQGVA